MPEKVSDEGSFYLNPIYSTKPSNSTNFAWGAGIQINPITNLVIDVGYEGSQLKANDQKFDLNGFNIGVGYKF